MSRCLIIINPVSGGGRARHYAMELQWQLSHLFDHMEIKFTTGAGDATRFAREASENGCDAVFCMGGDGTINETVNGIAQAGGKAGGGQVAQRGCHRVCSRRYVDHPANHRGPQSGFVAAL